MDIKIDFAQKADVKVLAIFDFDNTITTKDTLFQFLFFVFGYKKVLVKLLTISLFVVPLFLLHIWTRSKIKEYILSLFFKNMSINTFNEYGEEFANKIDLFLSSDAISKIRWHQEKGHKVIINSASIKNWIAPWAKTNGVSIVICTELEVKNDIITGKFSTPNCYGKEKVNRLLKVIPNIEDYIIFAYGDSKGDIELLELADYSYYKKFNEKYLK